MRKIAIVGSRDYNRPDKIETFIAGFRGLDVEIVSGGARGVDTYAVTYAKQFELKTKVFPADWESNGKRAGFLRNAQIVDYSDILVAFWDGKSRGTKDSIDKALKADNIKEIRVFKE